MKTITLFNIIIMYSFYAFSCPADSNGCQLLEKKMVYILNLKRAYEGALELSKKDPEHVTYEIEREIYLKAGISGSPDSCLIAYKESVRQFKKNKKQFLKCYDIGRTLEANQHHRIYDYDFVSSLISVRDLRNRMRFSTVYEVFKKYLFDLDRDTLPVLNDIQGINLE